MNGMSGMSGTGGMGGMPLPHRYVIGLDRHTRVLDGGRALLGGHPTRLLRLTPRARGLLTGRTLRVRDRAGAVLADRLLATGLAHPLVTELPPIDSNAPNAPNDPSDPNGTVTYVIPVRDRPDQLDRALASIRATTTDAPVIVVDDASHAPAPVAAVAGRHHARVLPLADNLGPAGARNAGLREVTTPYVVFIDSDIVLAQDTVDVLLRHFADPAVVLAVPRIAALPGPDAERWLGRYESTRSSLDLGRHPASVRTGTPVSWVPSACMLARTDALTKADGFDAGMRVGEDVDLCWRLTADGGRIRYEPAVQAAHEHRVELADWFHRKAVYGTGAHPLARRHPGNIAPAILAPWSAAMLVALLAQRRWSMPVAGGLAAVATVRNAQKLKGIAHPLPHAARLTALGSLASLTQGTALLTRHWWPLTVVGCLVSRRLRRATAVAAVTDVALETLGRGPEPTRLDPVRYAVARRLDDLAYGSGVWLSALKGRSTAALRPRIVRAAARPRSPLPHERAGPRGDARPRRTPAA
ncbi:MULTISPECIES: mycofactocin biosynthesis glycosyltransferase MftF [unclassified Streptomyces]|uniref:mycofactocin biosynthesis glycosyltransferase MftF n=1 Tax=unclassified Streptomyces TaxID=2593676 RepID=UPI002E17A123|nr:MULTISPECIES: mycofactocin biosynthesis glycosyltransferase MftF [unclassified Streptomyces]